MAWACWWRSRVGARAPRRSPSSSTRSRKAARLEARAHEIGRRGAGGTGGHLFPAEALAGALKKRGIAVDLATDARAAPFVQSFPARAVHVLPADTVRGGNPFALARTATMLALGLIRAIFLLRRI